MALTEPVPPDPHWPRYSDLPFPAYRFVPGLNPHPLLHPLGHSRSRDRESPPQWDPKEWRTLRPYLYGIDLYNYAYWWESHEVFEGLWHAAGRTSVPALFVKAILHAAVACLNRHRGKREGARRQALKALHHFERPLREGPVYMGLDVPFFTEELRGRFVDQGSDGPPLIRLRL